MLALDAAAAKNFGVSSMISEPGKYIGHITRAEKLESKEKGTKGIGISFQTENGQRINYLDIYYEKANGEKISAGNGTINAILACLRLRECPEGQIAFSITKDGKQETKHATGYPALMNKKIGLLLRKEISSYQGKERYKMEIAGVFCPTTELVAAEILDKKSTPTLLPKMVAALMENPIRDNTKKSAGSNADYRATKDGMPANNFNDFEDDIPF